MKISQMLDYTDKIKQHGLFSPDPSAKIFVAPALANRYEDHVKRKSDEFNPTTTPWMKRFRYQAWERDVHQRAWQSAVEELNAWDSGLVGYVLSSNSKALQ